MDNYTRVANHYFELSPEELYLYNYICMYQLRWFQNRVVTSVNVICEDIKLMKNENQNKNRIKVVLLSLHNKKVVTLDDIEIKNNGKIVINIVEADLSHGFECIPFTVLDMVSRSKPNDRANEFMVLCYILKVKKQVSFVEWANVLQVDESTAKAIIKDMTEKELIYKKSGRPYVKDNSVRQEMNSYSVNGKYDPSFPTHGEIQDTTEETDEHNWYDTTKKDLTVNDFVIFLTTDDEKLKKKAQSRINSISKNDKGKYVMDKLMREAEQKVQQLYYELELEEKRDQQKEIVQQVKSATGTVVKRDGKYIELNSIDSLQLSDCIVYVEKVEDTDSYSRFGGSYDALREQTVRQIITGESDIGSKRFQKETIDVLFNKFKETIQKDGCFKKQHLISIYLYCKDMLQSLNAGKATSELHEGDEFVFDKDGETNISMQHRVFAENKRQKLEQNKIESQIKQEFIEGMFE